MIFKAESYIATLVVALILSMIIIPQIRRIAFVRQLYDAPDSRKIHHGIVPRLGGLAFLPSIAFAFCLVASLNLYIFENEFWNAMRPSAAQILAGGCASLIMCLVGMADDLVGMRYWRKFIFQFLAASMLVAPGLWPENLHGFLGIDFWDNWLGISFSILGVMAVVNAINLIDGIDGLASGLAIMALLFYSGVLFRSDQVITAMIAAGTVGTLVPFVYHNIFGKAEQRTKIFMGDTGSLTIGIILGFIALKVLVTPSYKVGTDINVFILGVVPVLIPVMDVVRVFIHRIRRHRSPFKPDRTHIHHKLLALGWDQSKALVVILVGDVALMSVNMYASTVVEATWLILADIIIWSVLNVVLTRLIRRRERTSGRKLYD